MKKSNEHELCSDAIDVSIVIVAWNVKELLYDCMKSVYEQTNGIGFEVIYVDNGSKDGSIEMVKKLFPHVRIIENEKNEGFIRANNQAIKVARGKYVLLLNSDTVILDNAIEKTVKFADAHADAAVVGCRVLNPDMTLQRSCFMYPSILNMFLAATYLYKIFPQSRFFGREEMTWWDYDDAREVETICGCFSLVRSEAISQVGLMDERYFMYGDDPDWCFRFKNSGWKIMFTSDARIIHLGGQNAKHMRREFRWQLEGSKLIFMKLHRSRWSLPFACLLTALFFLLRVPYWFGIALSCKSKRSISFETAVTYFIGSFYCLSDWRRLLMNKDVVSHKL